MLKQICNFLKITRPLTVVRFKHSSHHWSVIRKQEQPTQKALNHFDDFYKQIYDMKWDNIRKALLGQKKYIAVVNNFGDSESVISEFEKLGALDVKKLLNIEKHKFVEDEQRYIEYILKNEKQSNNFIKPVSNQLQDDLHPVLKEKNIVEDNMKSNRLVDSNDSLSGQILQEFIPTSKIKGKEDFLSESSHYKLYDATTELGIKIVKEYEINFPEHLNIFCFEKDNKSTFDPPKRATTGVYNYYLMDGGSILPVLALNVRPGNRILDMCASPGGKSLLALQTLYPISIVSNDVSTSRLNKVRSAFYQFLFDFDEKWVKKGKVILTNLDGRVIPEGAYNRILVDAPCSTDRHSITENDNNIFKTSRIKERLQLPVLQKELLVQALKLVSVGGIVVYSTCSLNPIENDGVVHQALKHIWEETNMEFIIKDMNPALRQTKHLYKFYKGPLRFGHLVLPEISQNYGPTYFCKIQKIK